MQIKNLIAILLFPFLFLTCDSEDACKGDPISDCVCTTIYDPVCGCDNVTYSNACEAKCAGVKDFTIGACGNQQSTTIVGNWEFMGYKSLDALDLTNPTKSHIYDVNLNFLNETVGDGFFKVSGQSSVNNFFGNYNTSSDKLTLKDFGVTEILGTPAANAFENQYLKWLLGDLTFSITKDVLLINSTYASKTEVLVFRKK
jgi:heat shock protein HslJ